MFHVIDVDRQQSGIIRVVKSKEPWCQLSKALNIQGKNMISMGSDHNKASDFKIVFQY